MMDYLLRFNEACITVFPHEDDVNHTGDMNKDIMFQCDVNPEYHEMIQCYSRQHEQSFHPSVCMKIYIQFFPGVMVKRSDIVNKYLVGKFSPQMCIRPRPRRKTSREIFARCIDPIFRHPDSNPVMFGAPVPRIP